MSVVTNLVTLMKYFADNLENVTFLEHLPVSKRPDFIPSNIFSPHVYLIASLSLALLYYLPLCTDLKLKSN